MTRKKETYVTIHQHPTTKRIYFKSVDGYIETVTDTNGNKFRIGYNYDHEAKQWIATELSTGRRLNPYLRTKREVIDFVHRNTDKLNEAIQALLRHHQIQIETFREYAETAGVQIYPSPAILPKSAKQSFTGSCRTGVFEDSRFGKVEEIEAERSERE